MNRRQFLQRAGVGGVGAVVAQPAIVAAAPSSAEAATTSSVVYVPAPTGDPATDTTNIQSTIDGSPIGSRIVFAPMGGGQGYVVNATIALAELRFYQGANKEVTVIRAASGTNLPAVMATAAWLAAPSSGAYATGRQLTIESLTIDGNLAGNPTGSGHGLVLMNYRATVRDLVVSNTPGSGIVLSDRGIRSAVVASESCVENRLYDCTILYPGQYGVWVVDTALSGRVTDGYIENCVVVGPAVQGMRIERAAGWFIHDNHVYGCARDGIYLDQFWGTFFYDNEVDHYGQDGAKAPGTFYGIRVNRVLGGRPGAIHNCQVNAIENRGSSYYYYYIEAAGGVETNVMMTNNGCHSDASSAGASASVGYSYVVPSTSILHVQGQSTNAVYNPAQALSTGGGGTVLFDQPPDGPDALHLGFASTVPPGTQVGGTVALGAGCAVYAMFVSAGVVTGALRLHVTTAAGHVSLGVYASTSAGISRKPGDRRVTTGVIPCPAVGTATVLLPAPTAIGTNSYAALSVDNDQARVACVSTLVSAMTLGTAAFQPGAHPLPATAASANGNSHLPWITST
jgi:hypothetical protein